jgi:hypothetical protein
MPSTLLAFMPVGDMNFFSNTKALNKEEANFLI